MKFNALLPLSALVAMTLAEGLGDLPSCAKDCATEAISSQNCGLNVKADCFCKNASFLSDISCCVANKCSKGDQDTTLKVAKAICSKAGVSDIPTTVAACSSTSTGTATAATKTGTTTTSTDSSTSATTSSTNAAAGTWKDSSLGAAGAAAAFAILF